MKKSYLELIILSNIKINLLDERKNFFTNSSFFVILLFLRYILKKKLAKFSKKENIKKIFFFIKPFKKSTITYLRAPYRYKLARNQVTFSRYYLTVRIYFNTPEKNFKPTSLHSFQLNNNDLLKNFQNVSTNIDNLVSFKCVYNTRVASYFNINNF